MYGCTVHIEKYWMIYRWPGFLADVWFGFSHTSFPPRPSVSSSGDTQEYKERETSYWRERGRGCERSQIIRRRVSLCNAFINKSATHTLHQNRTLWLFWSICCAAQHSCADFVYLLLMFSAHDREQRGSKKRTGQVVSLCTSYILIVRGVWLIYRHTIRL
jgi:hypothetical protein